MKRLKKLSSMGAVTAAMAVGITLAGAGAASAAETPFGARSCSEGSVAVNGRTTQTPLYFVYSGGTYYSKSYASSGVSYASHTWYTNKFVIDRGGVQTGGAISSAYSICST